MIDRARIVLFLVAMAAASSAALGETTQLVSWSENVQLTWNQFLGTVPSTATPNDAAAIYMELKWHTRHDGKRDGSGWVGYPMEVIVSNVMNPQLSWARPGSRTAAALRHETYHFHLNEVYRRRLEAALLAVRVCGKTVEEIKSLLDQQVHQVADTWLFRAKSVQDTYETETDHGNNAAAQLSWEQKIDAWLANPLLAP